MVKKLKWPEEEEEEEDLEPEIEDDTEDMEDLDSEEGDVKSVGGRKKKGESYDEIHARKIQQRRTPAVYQRPEPVVKGGTKWLIRQIPQSFECVDPINGEIVLTAGSYEELMLNLQVMSTQHAVESAKNTR